MHKLSPHDLILKEGWMEILHSISLALHLRKLKPRVILKYITGYDRAKMESRFLVLQWICGIYSPLHSRNEQEKVSFLHYILRGKHDFSLYLSYFSQFALLSLEAGGLYQEK